MQDLYVTLVKDKLKRYVYAKNYIENAKKRIEELESKKEGQIIGRYEEKPPFGGVKDKDKLLNILAEIDLYKTNIKENEKIIKDIDICKEGISQMEWEIIFEIYGKPYKYDKLDYLKNKYHYSTSKIYKLANKTLEHFSLSLFGDY